MPKVIAVCGRLCSGKTTYAKNLPGNNVLLSVDEVMLALFGSDAGADHDLYAARTRQFLLNKSLEILKTGADVLLDWGFWSRQLRDELRSFYAAHGIKPELHYLDIPQPEWQQRIRQRNADIQSGRSSAYFVDDGLMAKFLRLFEPPTPDEIDIIIH